MNIDLSHLRAEVNDVAHGVDTASIAVGTDNAVSSAVGTDIAVSSAVGTLVLAQLSMAAVSANISAVAELNSVWNKFLGRDISAQFEVLKDK